MKKLFLANKRLLFSLILALSITIYSYLSLQQRPNPASSLVGEESFELVEKYEPACKCSNKKKANQPVKLFKNESFYLIDTGRSSYKIAKTEFDRLNQTCSLYKVLKRGLGQKVVSYSLYGRDKFYYRRLKNLTKQIQRMYPTGWSMRVYYDSSIDESIICDLECDDDDGLVDFCFVEQIKFKSNEMRKLNASSIHAMKWRWFPIGDSFVDSFVSRDADSSILTREIDAVNQWLLSGKTAHLMRDHPGHGTEILGGMWGFQNGLNRPLANHIFYDLLIDESISKAFNSNLKSPKGNDQYFLSRYIYPLIRDSLIAHDSYFCSNYEKTASSAFPSQRKGNCFVGNPFDCNQTETNFFNCPRACRPSQHPNWKHC